MSLFDYDEAGPGGKTDAFIVDKKAHLIKKPETQRILFQERQRRREDTALRS